MTPRRSDRRRRRRFSAAMALTSAAMAPSLSGRAETGSATGAFMKAPSRRTTRGAGLFRGSGAGAHQHHQPQQQADDEGADEDRGGKGDGELPTLAAAPVGELVEGGAKERRQR